MTETFAQATLGNNNCEAPNLPVCEYGAKCYRKNPAHFREMWHPTNPTALKIDCKDSSDHSTKKPEVLQHKPTHLQEVEPVTSPVENGVPEKNNKFLLALEDSDEEKPKEKPTQAPASVAKLPASTPSTVEASLVKSKGSNKISTEEIKKRMGVTTTLGGKCLAFPSFSTSTFEFDIERAAAIATGVFIFYFLC
jgi:hypothetical protein